MLGNNRAVNFGGIGYMDIARDQVGKHELMHGGRGGVYPAQLLSCFELLRTELPSNQHFGIDNLICQVVETGELNDLVFGKIRLQP